MQSTTTLRLNEELKAKIAKEAELQGRSQHNLVIWILTRYFADKEDSKAKS